MKWIWPVLVALSMLGVGLLLTGVMENRYVYFATYVILQYIVLATAWNILGGYTGYVNFGTPAFFALGAYTATFLMLAFKAPFLVLLLAGGLSAGLLGFDHPELNRPDNFAFWRATIGVTFMWAIVP